MLKVGTGSSYEDVSYKNMTFRVETLLLRSFINYHILDVLWQIKSLVYVDYDKSQCNNGERTCPKSNQNNSLRWKVFDAE